MAIMRLEDIGILRYSKGFGEECKLGKFSVYATGGVVGHSNEYTFEENSLILPRVGSLNIFFTKHKHSTKNTAFSFKCNEEVAIDWFIFLLLKKINFKNYNLGSAVPRLTSRFWNKLEIILPPLKEQQEIIDIIESNEKLLLKYIKHFKLDNVEYTRKLAKQIIDIIEPFEKLESINNAIIEKSEYLFKLFGTKGSENGKIIDSFTFQKGKNIPSKDYRKEGNNYLRVGDLRKMGSTFVSKENLINIFYDDILICFDGDPGRNNYGLLGVSSPSLYKILGSNKAGIYMSINHQKNQNIIKSFTNGTTILHSPGSKNRLFMFEYKHNLNIIFSVLCLIKEENIKNKLIKDKLIYKLIK